MPTLILSPRQTEDSQRLWRAAGQRGWPVERLASWRVPDSLLTLSEPVLYVEALMAPTLAEKLHLRLAEPPEDWLPTLPDEYRRRAVRLATLGEVRGLSAPAFVKPPNDKSFPAAVYDPRELPAGFPDEMPVLVSEVVAWEQEFRCFVLDRQVRTFSLYLRDGVLQKEAGYESTEAEDAELREFVGRRSPTRACRCGVPWCWTRGRFAAGGGRSWNSTPRGVPGCMAATRRRCWRSSGTRRNRSPTSDASGKRR